jgi:Protein of unknown function (DUF3224)
MRLRYLAAAAAMLLPVVGAGSTALAGEGGVWKKIPVSFKSTGTASKEQLVCNPNNQCLDALMGDDGVWTGDLQGQTMFGTTAAGPNAGNVVLQAFVLIFTGTVKECGTGSLTFIGKTRFDFDTLPAVDSDFVIVPDFGTGDLVGVTGSIHQHTSDQTVPLDGWVRCKVKGHH